jgi:hypothetical protein
VNPLGAGHCTRHRRCRAARGLYPARHGTQGENAAAVTAFELHDADSTVRSHIGSWLREPMARGLPDGTLDRLLVRLA